MKYSIFAIILAAFFLTACGEPKPGSKPPSLYKDEQGERMGAPAGKD